MATSSDKLNKLLSINNASHLSSESMLGTGRSSKSEGRRSINLGRKSIEPAIPVRQTQRKLLEITVAQQSELTAQQSELTAQQQTILEAAGHNLEAMEQFILNQSQRAEELQNRMEQFIKDLEEKQTRERETRELQYKKEIEAREQQHQEEIKRINELHAKQQVTSEKERSAREALFQKELDARTETIRALKDNYMQELKNLKEMHQTQLIELSTIFTTFVKTESKKNNDKRLQDSVGTRFGTGVSLLLIGAGVIIIFTANPAQSIIPVIVGFSSISLGVATSVGKICWRGIRSLFGRCAPSDCCTLEEDPEVQAPLLAPEKYSADNSNSVSPDATADKKMTNDDIVQPQASPYPAFDRVIEIGNTLQNKNLGSSHMVTLTETPSSEATLQLHPKPFLLSKNISRTDQHQLPNVVAPQSDSRSKIINIH